MHNTSGRGAAYLRGAIAAVVFACPAAAQDARLDQRLQETVLDNGLQVIVAENPAVPVATVLVAVRTGAFTQEPADEGISHLYEHLLFRSYGGDPSKFGRAVSAMGGAFNGTTNDEVVNYFIEVPSKSTKEAIKVLARLVREARFGDRDLKLERPVVLDELQRGESDPEASFTRRVDRQVWGDAWSRKDVGGDSASLAGITLARLHEIYDRYYRPNNAALIVTGDVSAADVIAMAREQFGPWQRGPDPFADHPVPPMPPLTMRRGVVMGGAVDGVTILLEWPGPSVDEDAASTYAADVLFAVLDAPTSAFQRRLVDSGLFQSVQGGYQTLAHVGPIRLRAQTTPERAQEALLTLLDEVDRLDALDGITPDDLKFAKRSREVTDALAFEATGSAAPTLSYWWSAAGLDYYRGYTAHTTSQTLDDLRHFANRYLVGRPMVIGVLGPPAVARGVASWLRTASGSARGVQ